VGVTDLSDRAARVSAGVRRRLTRGIFADPGPDCSISWKPSIFAPVFYGYSDTTAMLPLETLPTHGPLPDKLARLTRPGPGGILLGEPIRIFFPTLDGSPQHARILEGCGRYPLVILAHGQCGRDEQPYQKWFELPAILARCGYVVILPDLDLGAPSGNEVEQRLIAKLAGWARSDWEHKDLVMPRPATALVGHSWGGGLLGHVAADFPGSYAAYVSLSGVEVPGDLSRSPIPKLMTWGGDLSLEVLGVQISQWDAFAQPVHVAEFHDAGHWDYLPAGRSACDVDESGQLARGSCSLTPYLAADIVASFLTRYLRPEGVRAPPWPLSSLLRIPASLRPPLAARMLLTPEQEFYAGGHLQAWQGVTAREGCGVTLRWRADGSSGELVHT
jgi:pimeloyl-ACP methyl ester carboxylesterase